MGMSRIISPCGDIVESEIARAVCSTCPCEGGAASQASTASLESVPVPHDLTCCWMYGGCSTVVHLLEGIVMLTQSETVFVICKPDGF